MWKVLAERLGTPGLGPGALVLEQGQMASGLYCKEVTRNMDEGGIGAMVGRGVWKRHRWG